MARSFDSYPGVDVQLAWIASLVFAVAIALFAVQNTTPVDVNLLAWRIQSVAVSTLVLATAALGALLTYIFGLGREVRGRVNQRGQRATIRDQDTLITDLRTQIRDLETENQRLRAAQERAAAVDSQTSDNPVAPGTPSGPLPDDAGVQPTPREA
jgi:uncharacterized integral membrane protein